MERRVVMFSGGIGSWAAARRSVAIHGVDREDDDLYRFLLEAAAGLASVGCPAELLRRAASVPPLRDMDRRRRHLRALGADACRAIGPLEWIAEGRDPHEVYRDVRFLGNSRVDPCSAILKRRLMRRWLERHRDPAATVCVLGFDWTEVHRLDRAEGFWAPWRIEAPLTEKPFVSKEESLVELGTLGVRPPRPYEEVLPQQLWRPGLLRPAAPPPSGALPLARGARGGDPPSPGPGRLDPARPPRWPDPTPDDARLPPPARTSPRRIRQHRVGRLLVHGGAPAVTRVFAPVVFDRAIPDAFAIYDRLSSSWLIPAEKVGGGNRLPWSSLRPGRGQA